MLFGWWAGGADPTGYRPGTFTNAAANDGPAMCRRYDIGTARIPSPNSAEW